MEHPNEVSDMAKLNVSLYRTILLVVTTGGFTHAAPVLELGRVLAERGHKIEFATFDGQETWVEADGYEFVNRVHLLGSNPPADQIDAHYRRMQVWDVRKGIEPPLISKAMWDTTWPQTYHGLKEIMDNPVTRPDMIIADFFAEAALDMHVEYNLPIAIMAPNWPPLQLPCAYIPGEPGFQLPGTMTSENSSLWLRIKNETMVWRNLPAIMRFFRGTRKMRRENGVFYPVRKPKKPDYLLFVNSFVGLEIPRDLPPTCAPVGPLLSPTWPALGRKYVEFFETHNSVLYIALGTHIILPHNDFVIIVRGVISMMQEQLIDGVIWSIPESGRKDIDKNKKVSFEVGNKATVLILADLLANRNEDWYFPHFAPQRAILDHPKTKLYFTHGGGSSANEAVFHGKPMICMGIFFDQTANSTRLVAAGVAESLDKMNFSSHELYSKAMKIFESGEHGSYARNVLRLQRIAHVASRRKYYAADLIEEHIYDHELRFDKKGKEILPMHLQTADSRMSGFKVNNLDLWGVLLVGSAATVGLAWLAGKCIWQIRNSFISTNY
ncbi:hypothetical protein N7478_005914 [Penicillium angulare]|uniref:uncharacterized protein n=1 Tax=Penicillium angulare TaxID=116970 RepID=UPI0025401CF7|nr:uncharacterized protein N7478_005914 [Penicillium angulare]KAJ5280542.1 hypothetical protein N7478_005914 [Penicillium angulare]